MVTKISEIPHNCDCYLAMDDNQDHPLNDLCRYLRATRSPEEAAVLIKKLMRSSELWREYGREGIKQHLEMLEAEKKETRLGEDQ